MDSTERAVERLTTAHTEHTEAGVTSWPPLLLWLKDRITEINRKGNGSQGPGVPLNDDALELMQHIETRLRLMLEAVYKHGTGNTVTDTRTVWETAQNERAGGRMDDEQWQRIADELEEWLSRIEGEQDRPRKMELTVPCPRCEKRWYLDGEDRKAAVVVEFAPGRAPVAECRVEDCGAIWGGWADVARLGFTVGAEQNAEILAACGIDTPQIGTTRV